MGRKQTIYVCAECGATFYRWSGRCPNCQQWDTLQESQPAASARDAGDAVATPPVRLTDIRVDYEQRIPANMPEFDRVLGGGVLPGSTILLGGDPGIGKSTILLQVLGNVAARGVQCLYVSCEESLGQVKMRAARLGLAQSGLSVSVENAVENILAILAADSPRLAVVDSIQRVVTEGVDSPAGSLRQVSTCAMALTEAAKEVGCALFLVGHVTKQGMIAGPRALEHLVDTVLYFDSEKFQSLRILRAVKNRFGAINEIGVFEMTGEGLREVLNPSELFLAERDPAASGSVVTATMEGSRALLVEIQALVGPGAYSTPERKVTGVDYRRFSMMMSVLERQAGLELGRSDAFVNVAGGVRVYEPAADLPLVLALASSFRNQPLLSGAVAVGEVGLGGEVRAVSRIEQRMNEAAKLGFDCAVVPAGNAKAAARCISRVHPVRNLLEAVKLLGPASM